MNFCEGCNLACDAERCPKCGRKKLRTVNDEDFCLTAQVERRFGDALREHLEAEKIDCVLMPYGTGVYTKAALPLEGYLVYVRYKYLEYVRNIIKEARP